MRLSLPLPVFVEFNFSIFYGSDILMFLTYVIIEIKIARNEIYLSVVESIIIRF